MQKLRWWKKAARVKDFSDLVEVFVRQEEALDFAYIKSWCANHESLDQLAEVREAAAQ